MTIAKDKVILNLLLGAGLFAVSCLPQIARGDVLGFSSYQATGSPYSSTDFQNGTSPNASAFTLTSTAVLSRVILPLSEGAAASVPVNVSILGDTGGSGPGTVLATVLATGVPTGGYLNISDVAADFSSFNLTLNANIKYWVAEGASGPGATVYWAQTLQAGLPNPYGSTGTVTGPWVAYNPVTAPPAMKVFVVPEPSVYAMIMIAAAGGLFIRRRKAT